MKPRRLYQAGAIEPLAVVSGEPSFTRPGHSLVRVARGPASMAYGPYPDNELEARVQSVVDQLLAEGYVETQLADSLVRLQSPYSKVRARAALRLGRLGGGAGVCKALLEAIPNAVDDVCSLLDALGNAGDSQAFPVLRQYAARKLLSRRRSAVEAMRRLGDLEGLETALGQTLQNLPESLRAGLEGTPESLVEAIMALPGKDRGQALDGLYELDRPSGNAAVRLLTPQLPLERRDLWRYLKSIFKRATLRHDHETVAVLAHTVERYGRSNKGSTAAVKSGYDGEKRETPIFHRKTQNYLRRASWRYLRQLPADEYALAAAYAIVQYQPDDARIPRGATGAWADCYVLHRVLFGASLRFCFQPYRLRYNFLTPQHCEPSGLREEAFPERWDAHPEAYLIVLAEGPTVLVQDFGQKALSRHPQLLRGADQATLQKLLASPLEATVELALAELEQRLDVHASSLIDSLAGSQRPSVRALGFRWLEQSAALWCQDAEHILRLLTAERPELRTFAADLCIRFLSAAVGRQLAGPLWQRLGVDGEALVRVARESPALAAELDRLPLTEVVEKLETGSSEARGLSAWLLARRPAALAEIGLTRVAGWAEDELVAVRQAAHALLIGCQPGVLFALLESSWADTRRMAIDELRRLDREHFDFDTLVGFCDSNQTDVQDFGKGLLLEKIEQLDVEELTYRLAENPHRNLRRFALDLAVSHLLEGALPLSRVAPLCRALLLDLQPRREDKLRVVAFLTRRGLQDERQAGLAVGLLSELMRSATRCDFEEALVAIVELQLTYPQLKTPVRL